MNANDLLNDILYNACPAAINEERIATFRIETHCVSWLVNARYLVDGTYEILSATSEPCTASSEPCSEADAY